MMETQLLPEGDAAIALACQLLRQGQVVGIPTETVYGLAANACDEEAVKKIYAAKGRPSDNPLIVHVSDMDMFDKVAHLNDQARRLAAAFCPGPLTIILPKKDSIPPITCGGLPTVAVRMPSHPGAHRIIAESGLPLAAPSANLSGKPSPTNAPHVFADMQGRIPLVIDGGECAVGVESTVISLAGETPVLLRPGYITLEQLEAALGQPVEVADAVLHQLQEGQQVLSPGMKYKHYAPKAEVTIVEGTTQAYCAYVNAHRRPGLYALCYEQDIPGLQLPYVCYGSEEDPATQAKELFTALRHLDELGATEAYAHFEDKGGVSLAVHNRILRAAAFRVIDLTKEGEGQPYV